MLPKNLPGHWFQFPESKPLAVCRMDFEAGILNYHKRIHNHISRTARCPMLSGNSWELKPRIIAIKRELYFFQIHNVIGAGMITKTQSSSSLDASDPKLKTLRILGNAQALRKFQVGNFEIIVQIAGSKPFQEEVVSSNFSQVLELKQKDIHAHAGSLHTSQSTWAKKTFSLCKKSKRYERSKVKHEGETLEPIPHWCQFHSYCSPRYHSKEYKQSYNLTSVQVPSKNYKIPNHTLHTDPWRNTLKVKNHTNSEYSFASKGKTQRQKTRNRSNLIITVPSDTNIHKPLYRKEDSSLASTANQENSPTFEKWNRKKWQKEKEKSRAYRAGRWKEEDFDPRFLEQQQQLKPAKPRPIQGESNCSFDIAPSLREGMLPAASSSSSHLKSQPCISGEYVGLGFLVTGAAEYFGVALDKQPGLATPEILVRRIRTWRIWGRWISSRLSWSTGTGS